MAVGHLRAKSSTLRRARQTAQIIDTHFRLEIVFDADLCEAEGPYLHNIPLRAGPLGEEPSPPFEPEYEALRERVSRATARILTDSPEAQVLVVAHGGAFATMIRCILGTHTLLVRTEQAAVHCLRWEDGRWNLQYVNRQEHL